jgi:hypothetical protein
VRRLGVAVLVTLGLSVAVGLLIDSDWGRRQIARVANERVSAAIGGALRIGAIDRISLPTLWARDVQLVAPDGVAAIAVERAEVEIDLAALLHGTFAFVRADVRGGVVRVLADPRGRINMEETFRSAAPDEGDEDDDGDDHDASDTLDLRGLATSGMTLIIEGKDLPSLKLREIVGIMRVHVLGDGRTELRFDGYRGRIVRGLPSGELAFRDVRGMVQTGRRRLLRFEGAGESEDEPVRFTLDVAGAPEKKAVIDATFERLTPESISTRFIAAFARATGGVTLRVHRADRD